MNEENDLRKAAQKLQALGYEWKGDEWVKPAPPETYGCHCDLATYEGQKPDGCVLDIGRAVDCVYAQQLLREGKGRDDCHEWRPVVFVSA